MHYKETKIHRTALTFSLLNILHYCIIEQYIKFLAFFEDLVCLTVCRA